MVITIITGQLNCRKTAGTISFRTERITMI